MYEPIVMLPAENGVLPERILNENVCTLHSEPLLRTSNKALRFGNNIPKLINLVFSGFLNYWDLIKLCFFALPRYISQNKIDILYANNETTRVLTMISGALTKTPVVWHLRNVKRAQRYSWLARSSFVTHVIFISHAQRNLYDIPEAKSGVVYNGIDTSEFCCQNVEHRLRKIYHIAEDTVIFAVAGRIIEKKGYDHFLRAAKIVKESSHRECRFVIIGGAITPSQSKYLIGLQKLCVELGIEKETIFTGFQKDIKSFLADIDVMVIPSIWAEPFGRTAIEAMAFEKPVIAYGAGGLPEVIREGITGFICPVGHQTTLANAMLRYVNSTDLRTEHGACGSRDVKIRFDIKQVTREIEKVLSKLNQQV